MYLYVAARKVSCQLYVHICLMILYLHVAASKVSVNKGGFSTG